MATWTVDRRLDALLDETSDVTWLPGRGFLVVSDVEARAAIVGPAGTAWVPIEGVEEGESGLEAVAFDASEGILAVFAEERRELLLLRWSGREDERPALASRRTISPGKKANKGVEGMIHLGPGASPTGRAGLLLANEDKPRRLYFLEDGATEPVAVAMDRAILEACDDLSGLAWDGGARRALLVSDESASLVEISLTAAGGEIAAKAEAIHALVDEDGDALERVEGVVVDDEGAVWVLLENARQLCRVRARRG